MHIHAYTCPYEVDKNERGMHTTFLKSSRHYIEKLQIMVTL